MSEVDPVERARPVPECWSDGRHSCHSLHVVVLNGAEQVLGPEGLAGTLRRAGETRSLEVLRDTTRWCSHESTIRLLEILADALGGQEAFRRAACWFDPAAVTDAAADVVAVFQSMGGPAGILRQVAEAASKFTTVATMETGEVTHDGGLVRLRMAQGFPPHPLLCDVVAGLLSVSSQLFGLPPATVSHERCLVGGDDDCEFEVRWSDDAPGAVASELQVEQEVAVVRRRFEALRSTVVELVSGHDVDIVLDRMIERAARAVRAPSYLLVVRLADDEPARTHAIGLPKGLVDALTAELLGDGPTSPSSASRLVVDIRSDRRFYGRLAAFGPEGIAFVDEERRTFDAYAALAAAALDSATAMAEVRRQAATAQALLDLAHAVSDVTTKEDVAGRLVSAVPTVVGATVAGVLLHDRGRLVAAASYGLPHEAEILFDRFTIDLADAPRLRETVEHGRPFVVATQEANGLLRELLTAAGANTTVLVPIRAGHQLYGVVSAGLGSDIDRIPVGGDLITRLTGLAALASTAFRNAELLERLRHESLHDPLTGAPNRRLLEDRVDRAVAECRRSGVPVALLLLDLDHFKTVNDTLGHAAGDGILHRVVERLQRAVRQVDTVARLGGDEFAVLLPGLADPADAAGVAEKLLAALRAPFRIEGHVVTIDASVGIAVAPADGDSCPALLKAADTAMYAAKSAGRTRRQAPPAASTAP